MAQTFDPFGDQTFEDFGDQTWDGVTTVAPWTDGSNADFAFHNFGFSWVRIIWPSGNWSTNDALVMVGLYPMETLDGTGGRQIGGFSQVFRSQAGQIGGVGEVYI